MGEPPRGPVGSVQYLYDQASCGRVDTLHPPGQEPNGRPQQPSALLKEVDHGEEEP